MKKMMGLMLVALISSTTCHALVKELALCTTSDGQYTVSVQDNQGIGPVRTSYITASVYDSNDKVVASYEAEEFRGVHSISFGRPKYQDTATAGKGFLLEGPSTNFKHYSLNVEMNAGGKSGRVSNDDLNCSVFGGVVYQ